MIELLAVTGILALIIAVAVPELSRSIASARYARARADISAIHKSVETYRILNGKLPDSMNDLIPNHISSIPVDPWGTAYTYNNFQFITPGERRKDGPLVPINKEYDIFSAGPDRKTTPNIRSANGKDDVILANDGGFIDVATKY